MGIGGVNGIIHTIGTVINIPMLIGLLGNAAVVLKAAVNMFGMSIFVSRNAIKHTYGQIIVFVDKMSAVVRAQIDSSIGTYHQGVPVVFQIMNVGMCIAIIHSGPIVPHGKRCTAIGGFP